MAASSQEQQDWRDFITAYYPDYLGSTHCVPPVHFNRVAYQHDVVAGQPVLVAQPVGGAAAYLPDPNEPVEPRTQRPRSARRRLTSMLRRLFLRQMSSSSQGQSTPVPKGQNTPPPHRLWEDPPPPSQVLPSVQESDVRDDFAQQHVLHNLQCLGTTQGDGMFILSQLILSNYLNQPCYAATVSLLPTPSGLGPKKDQGEFDVLVFHRQHGVLVGEIKSVGLGLTCAPSDAAVAKRVKKAAEQLEKSGVMVEHLLQDVAPRIPVRKALMLPYVTRSQLLRVLKNDPSLEQDVCRSVGACDSAEAVALSVCCEQLSAPASPWRVEGSELAELTRWWSLGVANKPCPIMTDKLYLDILARFVGPATSVSVHCVSSPRVEVRTRGQAVAEVGKRVACIVLTPRQLDILNRHADHVALVGPPGTGKTVMLGLTGLRGLREGHDVHVLSTDGSLNLGASQLLFHQLQQTVSADPVLKASAGLLEFHEYDFTEEGDVKRALRRLVSASRGRQLCILADEIRYSPSSTVGPRTQSFVADLIAAVPGIRLWTACVHHEDLPVALNVEAVTFALRCAPAVLREVVAGTSLLPESWLHPYSQDAIPSPADGPSVRHLHHGGVGHTGVFPDDCLQCGLDLAGVFKELGVGAGANPPSPNAPTPLQYRDIFVITRSDVMEETRDASTGRVTREASGVVRGLRQAGVPVHVVGLGSNLSDIREMAVALRDKVTVAHWGCVAGLERKVLVWLHGREEGVDDGRSAELIQRADRLYAVSRCTTQLIVVNAIWPDTDDADASDEDDESDDQS